MNKTIIWALFDDCEMSYMEALRERENIVVYSFGINNKQAANYFQIDLSVSNLDLIKELKKLKIPKPDIILASPPCQSWSNADTAPLMIKEINKGIRIVSTREDYDNHNNKHFNKPQMRRNYFDKEGKRIIGEGTAIGLVRIIEEFEPDYWVVENPQSSQVWKYFREQLNFSGFKNLAYYNNYDNENFTRKPTIFMANIQLILKHNSSIKSNLIWEQTSYNKRASIPHNLINEIINQIEGGE